MLCLFLLQLVFVLGDLPVHCLHKSVTGSWKLDISSGSSKFHNCGFKAPDRNRDHQNAYKFDVEHSKHVSLNEPNLVSGDLTGYWTMVYDEGFEIRANETKYFAFSKYEPKGETLWQQSNELTDYVSDCGETLVGWWESDLGQYGCWKGVKSDAESLKGATNDLVTTSVLSPVDRLKEKVLAKESGKDGAKGAVSSAFVMNFEKKFEPDYSYIERVNKDTSSTWQASVHAPFVGRTWKEMKALLGIGNYVTANFTKVTAKARTKGKYNLMSLQADQTPSGLPLSWDWRNVSGVNYDSPVVNQGSCGACYAIAGTQMIESRVRVATKNQLQPILSAQNILDCSVYNQGCDGGYPYLVMKHAHDFGMIEATCSPYSATSSNCDSSLLKPRPVGIELQRAAARATKACDRRYYVSDFHYIGGYYGGTTETEMMKELYKNGPIVVAFQAPPTLFYYSNGIFTGARPKDEKNSGVVHAWEQANHAVVVVGYGVENGKKFWTIKNTWGAQWGEGGYFRIMRGTDECGIESMSSYATVLV